MKKLIVIFAFLFSGLAITEVSAQFGSGLVLGFDWYQWYKNPAVVGETDQLSGGNVILNTIIGPKFWFGGEKFSLSVEGQVNWGMTAFDMHEYKGMGNLSFPLMAKLNFGGLSGFGKDKRRGFYLGSGIQFSRTEAYGLTADFDDNTTRKYFRTIVGEIGFGSGEYGIGSVSFVRVGIGENNAFTLNIGSVMEFNVKQLIRSNITEEHQEQIQSFP